MTYSALKMYQNTGRGELISKIRFQPVDSLPPACALPSAPSLLISTTKLQHKSPESKNQPFITRKNLLTNRPFRLKKPKRYICALQRIYLHFVYVLFAEKETAGLCAVNFLRKTSTFSVKVVTEISTTCCHTVQYYSITVLQFTIWNRYRSLLYI